MRSTTSGLYSSKKPEDNTKLLENIRKIGTNKECFDCGEKVNNKINCRELLI